MDLFGGLHLSPFQFTCVALGSSIVSVLTAWVLAGPARRRGIVSRHRRDRFGAGRIPLTGGPGLLVGVVAAMLVVRQSPHLAGGILVVGMFLVGLADDLFELRPLPKLALQSVLALTFATLWAHQGAGMWGYAVLLTLLLVNACNYLDNMDGLLAGVVLTQALALMFFSTVPGPGSTFLVWALPGVALLTLPPARVYLGDSGSHMIGAILAVEALSASTDQHGVLRPQVLFPLMVLFAVPLVDMATVTISRARRKRPLFRGGTDHLSHRLVRVGWTVPRAVLILVLASAVCGVASLFLLHAS
ncbi:MAG: MraY family glycosyltransferase [Planctomycetota bacterium]|jgi:UDP-GlcNAc:undecaprenyl-phosphate GlcNAc-1-phosphate transferase